MVGTYAALYSFFLLTDSFWLACLMGVIGAAAVGLAIERFAVRPLKGNQWTTAVATVGCAFFLENIVSYVTNPRPESFPRPFENVTYYRVVGDAEVSNLQILLVILSFFLMVGVVLFLSRTALGKAIRVLGQSQDIAQCVGIDTRRVTMYTFALSGALGGVAGMINSVTFGSTEPYIGTFFGLKGIVVIIVAGVGNMRGALAVGVLLGLLESFVVIFRGGDLSRHHRLSEPHPDPAVSPDRPVRPRGPHRARGVRPMSASFALDLLTDYGVWLLFGLGLHILMLCGQLSLGHGAIVGIGAYSAAIMTVKLGVPYYAVIPLCALVGAASGFIIAVVIASRLSGIYLALGTFALGEAIITFWLNVDYVGSAIAFTAFPWKRGHCTCCCWSRCCCSSPIGWRSPASAWPSAPFVTTRSWPGRWA